MKKESMHFIMYISKIFRNTQIYLDKVLKEFGLTNGSCSYLFVLEKNEGISQNKLSEEIGNDKAMSARTITKLIEQGYVYKEQHEKNSRAYKLYLTDKAKEIMPNIHKEIQALVNLASEELSEEEMLITMKSLKKIYDSTQRFRE
ncbi:MarR family winged helix-turn-helix transcriptional regulator [Clostridium folliculivorans]|uniref:MarR family transcriptional regulator n=1 Tax=Clostridium folliculivorans TaxID=2886038 RepID=A0A9W6DA52_9CLOT|nr:MarR family winged helix-turn-helix transcriptional regulator [Clostridium folliculivorans]GKU24318.1 MarR family transcriptional regulator [Clostridium folliculivorans]GKU30422.1 MarR family transcriptional regulator [Clostridium folliculivorans]